MSYVLPNGATIGVTTLAGLDYIHKCLSDKTPIVVTSVARDGRLTTHTLWRPDDPVFDFAGLALGYQEPS